MGYHYEQVKLGLSWVLQTTLKTANKQKIELDSHHLARSCREERMLTVLVLGNSVRNMSGTSQIRDNL